MGKQKSKEEIHGLSYPSRFPTMWWKSRINPIEKGGETLYIVFCIDAHIFPEIKKTPQNRRHLRGSYFWEHNNKVLLIGLMWGRRNKLTKSPKTWEQVGKEESSSKVGLVVISISHGLSLDLTLNSCTYLWLGVLTPPDSSSQVTSYKLGTNGVLVVYCRFTIMGWPRSDVQPWNCKKCTHISLNPGFDIPLKSGPNPKQMGSTSLPAH